MRNKSIIAFFFYEILISFFFLFICGCNAKKEIVLENPSSLYLYPDVSWALVTDPYATYRKTVGWQSEANGHCRMNEVIQVLGKSSDAEGNVWYKFENGFLPASSISVFNNRYKALASIKGE